MFVSEKQRKFNVLKTNLFEIVTKEERKKFTECDSPLTHIFFKIFPPLSTKGRTTTFFFG
jgi:hypothetical protein